MNSHQVIPGSIAGRHLDVVLTTIDAAAVLNRKPQTLRKWACLENGPIRPLRINGRLAWRFSDIQALLNGGQ
ncbi:helix-turn-helix domain-containing protein [Ralstonia pseudosolanacearum]|uniref:DNA-binding protein n=1 Tax=Ralstonia solanacearum TaxID=305 RepID=A0AA92EEU8_RALSL|nr:helix-turn-helix domain-containing protein [Ralstonia pseudosolanacearum]QCX50692.1 DNA-binding protein [Ralstonia pseudosolanacearum]